MDASSNSDVKSRGGLGPRLKSYLSSGSLFGLVPSNDSDHEIEDDDDDWPTLVPVYDETTTTCSPALDRWILAVRHRLLTYDDVPLGTEYNAPLLWMTEQCIRVSKENRRLTAELIKVNRQNQELLRARLRSSSSLHHPSNSLPNAASSEWIEPPQHPHSKYCTVSFSNETAATTTEALNQENTGQTTPHEQEISLSGMPFNLYTTQSGEFQKHMCGGNAIPETCQSGMLCSASVNPEHLSKDSMSYKNDTNDDLQLSIAVPGSISLSHIGRSRPSSSHHNLQSLANSEVLQKAEHKRRKSSGSIAVSARRVFSFCPGDDNDVLESFAEYSRRQQQPALQDINEYLGSSTIKEDKFIEGEASHTQDHKDLHISCDVSNSSVITVVKASEKKKVATRIPRRENKKAPEQPKSSEGSREPVPPDKPQGPLAAALAATARFGKGGKKTIRAVSTDLQS